MKIHKTKDGRMFVKVDEMFPLLDECEKILDELEIIVKKARSEANSAVSSDDKG